MRKFVANIFAAILLLTPVSAYAADVKLQDVIAATPQINKNCSGTVIYSKRDEKSGDVKTIILTAKHCVENNKDSEQIVEFPVYQNNRVVAKKEYVGKVLGTSYKADLGLIELKDKDTLFDKVSKLAPSSISTQIGDPVVTIGYPLGMALTVTDGLFGAVEVIDFPKGGTEYYRSTPMIAPGNSGGAMYIKNEAGDYQLAGVTTAMVGQLVSFIGLYTPSNEIQDYLKVALPEVAEKKGE